MKRAMFLLLRTRPIWLMCTFILALPILLSVSFTTSPAFNSGNPVFTDETLTCSWTYSGDATTQNITVYREGIYFDGRNETGTLNTSFVISTSNTTKNEEWECIVRLNNATDSTTSSVNVTIQNKAPETPTIYNSSNADIGTMYTDTEDTSYIFDVNSSDVDNDTLTYYFKAATQGFCTMLNSSAGTANCTPENDDHNGSATNNNITFWVDDDDVLFAKSASKKVTFVVIPNNDAPTVSLTNQTTPVNATLTYDIDAGDEEANSNLTFELLNIPSEISSKVSISSSDNDTGQFVYNASTPDFNDVNTTGWLITVNVTDSLGASTIGQFYLNITAVGRAPEIINITPSPNATRFTLNQGENILINITANDSDINDTHTFLDDSTQSFFTTTTLVSLVNATGNTTGQVNFTATNDDVGQFSVTISVRDAELLTATAILNFTVNNVNDAPNLYELSTNASNTNSNTNLTNITSYADATLYFVVNASDVDTQYGDILTYSDNTTLFDINNATGVISFTPDSADVSVTPYHVNITVVDNESEQSSRTMFLYILNNTAPYFSPTPPNATCSESVLCAYNLSLYATDVDAGDAITLFQANTTLASFVINNTTGYINFTPSQSEIGNYTINFTITDTRGATNTTSINLEINNTEETPVVTRYNFSAETIVESHLFVYQLQAQDNDLTANVSENISFSTNLTFVSIANTTVTGNQTAALLSFTPNSSQVGTHTINITATDATNRINSQIFSFTVLAESAAPIVELVQPYGNTSNASFPIESYNITSLGGNTTLSFVENRTYLFAHVTTDDLTATDDLNTTWFYDGTVVATTWNYTRTFNFTSSGTHTLRLQINDTYLETTYFNWTLNITNANRDPLLLNDLANFTNITGVYDFSNYLGRYNDTTHFIDPDDDLSANNIIDGSESDSLTYTVTECTSGSTEIAEITITGDDITITPTNQGSCTVLFTATDASSVSLDSNVVFINVTEQPEGEEETETVTQSSGGGGGSNTRSSFIPLTREVEKPEALNIISPALVTIYDNNSVIIPFEVKNTWTDDLEFIQLAATTNESTVQTILSSNFIESLPVNQSTELFLEVSNYRLGSNYEVEITANVSNPDFSDSALILLTSIEQSSDGDELEVKVTFARDLFNEHPECQELNELLDKAQQEIAQNNLIEAEKYVDTAINGCRHLVSTLQQNLERPRSIPNVINLSEATLSTLLFTALSFLIMSTIGFIIYYHYTSREEDDI